MKRRPLIVCVAAGAALSLSATACTGKKGPDDSGEVEVEVTQNPPPPTEDPPPETLEQPEEPDAAKNPPEPTRPPPPTNPPAPGGDEKVLQKLAMPDRSLPPWDSVKSPHPEGATNPPSPVLIVTPDGDCYKRWEGGMIPTGGDRVEVVSADGSTTKIQCPPDRAKQTFEAWVAEGKPDPTEPGFPPKDF